MKTKITALVITFFSLVISSSVFADGYLVTSDLWIKAVINTVEKGPIEAVWQKGGEDTTSRGDTVIWGHFYASPFDVTWGSQNNPDLYVKIWFDVSGRIDVNFFHVSVPDIEVYSDYPYDGTWDQHGTTTMANRYVRHEYWRENPEPITCENMDGTWTGTWYSIHSISGNISASISQVDCNLTGSITLTNTDLGTVTTNFSEPVNGNILDLSLRWSAGGYSGRLDINGTLSGNSITGNYDLYVDSWGHYDYGTFIIER